MLRHFNDPGVNDIMTNAISYDENITGYVDAHRLLNKTITTDVQELQAADDCKTVLRNHGVIRLKKAFT